MAPPPQPTLTEKQKKIIADARARASAPEGLSPPQPTLTEKQKKIIADARARVDPLAPRASNALNPAVDQLALARSKALNPEPRPPRPYDPVFDAPAPRPLTRSERVDQIFWEGHEKAKSDLRSASAGVMNLLTGQRNQSNDPIGVAATTFIKPVLDLPVSLMENPVGTVLEATGLPSAGRALDSAGRTITSLGQGKFGEARTSALDAGANALGAVLAYKGAKALPVAKITAPPLEVTSKPKLKPKQLAEALRREAVEETANKTPTSPALEERRIRLADILSQGEGFTAEAAAKRTSEAGELAAAAALELKRMDVPSIGDLASPEELGVLLQTEARAQMTALKEASDKKWTALTDEMDALEASKTGVNQTISYGQEYKDFIKELNKRASATVGDPQDRQYAKLLLKFVDEKYPMKVKPSHLMEMKRYIAETAFDPASGFKAIASRREKEYVDRLDDMLSKHFTDPKTGTSPYDLRNTNYENFITNQKKLYSSRYGRNLTDDDSFGNSLKSPTEAFESVFGDPQAVRAALAQGVSVPTIEATMTRNLANEFDGKTPEAIAKLLQPGGKLYSILEIPQLAKVKEETRKYLTNITDQKQNSLKIDSYNTVAEKFAKEASQLEAAAVKSGTSAKNQERRVASGEKILEAKRAALLGKLNDAKGGDIKEMMALAKEAFVGNEPKLSEIRRVEKMNVSDDEKRKRIRRILIGAGAALGLAAANTRIGSDTIALVTGE